MSLVMTCHHTKILYNYRPYSPYSAFHTHDSFIFTNKSLYLLISFTYIFPLLTSLPSGNHVFFLCICGSVSDFYICSFVLFFRFHISKSYRICVSQSDLFHLIQYSLVLQCHKRKLSFCFMAGQYFIVLCVYMCTYMVCTWYIYHFSTAKLVVHF